MLFNKSIISFIDAIALATSVTATLAPAPTPHPAPANQIWAQVVAPICNTGNSSPACCGSAIHFDSLTPQQQTELHSLDPDVIENLNVGMNCAAAGAQGSGNTQTLCCDAIQNTDNPADLPGVAANCVTT
ncbi:hypothetical protein EI94DRAFT_1834584 [Lactarius quietus]|nr:hypothetical protein EI94DRAFT_1834584 [Lactarius quietus]